MGINYYMYIDAIWRNEAEHYICRQHASQARVKLRQLAGYWKHTQDPFYLATRVGQCQACRALFWPVLNDIQQVFVPETEVSNSKITVLKPVILLLTAKCVAS